jgi:hypothetical protein
VIFSFEKLSGGTSVATFSSIHMLKIVTLLDITSTKISSKQKLERRTRGP